MSAHSTTRPAAKTVLSLSALALLITGAVLYAGPLNPPAGPVTSTFKTLTDVEPRTAINAANTPGDADSLFKITQPGSYYLTGNITGVANKNGIKIAASGVTLDLNGFDVSGVANSLSGVVVNQGSLTNIAVVNGSVRNWQSPGVYLGPFNEVSGCRVEGIVASGNASIGILVGGFGSVVERCTATQNGSAGISANAGSTISNCAAYFNTGSGISAGGGCTISNCSAYDNNGSGFDLNSGCTVSNCTASENNASGIVGLTGVTVVDCTSRTNRLDGISVTDRCTVRGNTCSGNGFGGNGAGIRVTDADNRIEGNNCIGADLGIVLLGAGNVMFKNTCSGNTINYDIFTGNRYGPIINIIAANPATVSGNSAASTMGSTDPWANFAY